MSTDRVTFFDPAGQWVDLAQHVERMWGHYAAAVVVHSPTNVYPEHFDPIWKLFEDWRTRDSAPSRS